VSGLSAVEIEVLADAEAVAGAAAERIAAVARRSGHIALAGGSTPRRAYELLRDAELRDATLWFSDDRAVPPDSEDSNFRMASEALLDHLPEPRRPRVHRIEGELGADAAADRYEALVRAELGGAAAFDLVLLGLGSDAHTASLFPGKPAVEVTDRLVVAVPEAGLAPWVPRVTFTFALLGAARAVVLLVAGEDKAEAVARAFGPDADPSLPAARLPPGTSVVLDEAAAAGLRR
jgi:6-phosphogluconolactonase